MKIFAPLRDKKHVTELAMAGVDEFYCGLVLEDWMEEFGESIEMNRRSACKEEANFMSLQDLKGAVEITHSVEKKILLAINHHQFTNKQLPYVYKVIDQFSEIGGDGVILADLNAIRYAKNKGVFVAGSTDLNIYNVASAMWLVNMGVDRIILSRDIPLETIIKIKNQIGNVELETFMYNGPCKFSDSLCLGLHSTSYGAFCRFLNTCSFNFKKKDDTELTKEEKSIIDQTYSAFLNDYMNTSCGLCALWRLIKNGINACKVVGRVLPVERVKKDVSLVEKNIRIALNSRNEEEYLANMVRPDHLKNCNNGYQCFYPNEIYYVKHDLA